MPSLQSLAAGGLLILGALVMTIGVIGIIRMPNLFMKIHAASKSVFLGVCAILASSFVTADADIMARAALIAALLILTTPVAAYEIARAHASELRLIPDLAPRISSDPDLSVLPPRIRKSRSESESSLRNRRSQDAW